MITTTMHKIKASIIALVTSENALRNILILMLILCSPALLVGIHSDDYWHYAFINDAIPIKATNDISLFGLFSFVNADPERLVQLVDLGFLPWWTYEGYKIMFWRPLSEVTHWLDYTLWPSYSTIMHLQSIAWYLALLCMLYRLYGRVQTGKIAIGMALLLYAIDASHAVSITWLAGRNALLATFFGASVLYFHIRARQDDWPIGYTLALMSLILGLLSAEYHVAVGAYLFAYAVTLDKKGAVKGFISLLPYLCVVAIWWALYKASGFGAGGTNEFYIDPAEEPKKFLTAMSHRIVALLGSQWGIIPADLYRGGIRPYVFGIGIAVISSAIYLIAPIFKHNKSARFWAVGMLISALPVCAPAPTDRLLMFIGIGACGLFGSFIQYWIEQNKNMTPIGKGRSIVAGIMITFHIMLSGVLFPVAIYSAEISGDSIRASAASIPQNFDIKDKKLVLFNSPAWLTSYLYSIWYHGNEPLPNKLWGLTTQNTLSGGNKGTLTPINNHEVEVTLDNGFMTFFDKIFRDHDIHPLNPGDIVSFGGLTTRIVELTDDNRPKTVIFSFEETLDDPDLVWLIYGSNKQFTALTLPPYGHTIELK